MAILDAFGTVSTNQACTGAPSALGFFPSNAFKMSGSSVAVGQFRDAARGNPIVLRFQVTETFVGGGGGGAATSMDVVVLASDDDDSAGGGATPFLTNLIVMAKWSNVTALLVNGNIFTLPIPSIPQHLLTGPEFGRRYLGVAYTPLPAGNQFTAGKITAEFGVWRDLPKPLLHATGYTGP